MNPADRNPLRRRFRSHGLSPGACRLLDEVESARVMEVWAFVEPNAVMGDPLSGPGSSSLRSPEPASGLGLSVTIPIAKDEL